MIEDGYWALLEAYLWPGPNLDLGLGPITWQDQGTSYDAVLMPFYDILNGRVINYSLYQPAYEGMLWNNSPAETIHGTLVASTCGILSKSSGLAVSNAYDLSRGLSLRCLTQ